MEPEQYALMARVERDHWWYTGMRRLAAALLERELAAASGADGPGNGGPAAGRNGSATGRDSREGRVLDAGCGTGGTTAWLRRYGAVVGVDVAAEAVPFWHQRRLRCMVRGSVEALPVPTASFDVLTCFDVLYHHQVPDEAAALREFWRVLRPGGLLLLRVPAYNWLQGAHDAAVHTRRRFTRREVVAAVRAAGFEVAADTYGNWLLFPLAMAKRLGERWLGGSQTEMALPPPALNALFRATLGLEARLAPRWPLPWGLSVLVVARKPGAPSHWVVSADGGETQKKARRQPLAVGP